MHSGESAQSGDREADLSAGDAGTLDTPLIQTTVRRVLSEIQDSPDVNASVEAISDRIRHQLAALETTASSPQKLKHAAMLLWLLTEARAEIYPRGSRALSTLVQTAEDLLCACLVDALPKRGGDLELRMLDVMRQSFADLERPCLENPTASEPNLPVLMSVTPREAGVPPSPPPRLGRRGRDDGRRSSAEERSADSPAAPQGRPFR